MLPGRHCEANDSLLKLAVFPVPCMSSYTLTPSLVLTDYTNIKLSSNLSEMISLVDSFLFPIFVIKCASATFYLSLIDHKTLILSLSYHAVKCRNIAHSLALCWVKSENFAALKKKKKNWWQHWWWWWFDFRGRGLNIFFLSCKPDSDILHYYKSWCCTTQWTKHESDGTVNHKLLLHN